MPFDSRLAALISQLLHASPIRKEMRSRWYPGGIRIACCRITITRTPPRETLPVAFSLERQLCRARVLSAKDSHWLAFRLCELRKLRPVYRRIRLYNYLSAIASRSAYPWTRAGSRCVHTRQRFAARRSAATRSRVHARLSRAGTRLHYAHRRTREFPADRRPYCLSRVHRPPPRD